MRGVGVKGPRTGSPGRPADGVRLIVHKRHYINAKKELDKGTKRVYNECIKGKEIIMKTQRRYGWNDDKKQPIICTVTGEMSDGTKVWTECDANRNLIDIDTQYILRVRNQWNEFIRL